MVRPLIDWVGTRQTLVDAALKQTADPYELENGESITVTYALSNVKPRATITAVVNLQKVYDETTKAFTLVADSNPDDPAPPPVDESTQ